MKKKIMPFVENIAEAGTACLLTMVQGNLLLVGVSHWITASTTGLIAGAATATAFTLANTDNRVVLAVILGLATAVVDFFVHPGMIGDVAIIEAIITGLGAGILSFAVGTVLLRLRGWRARRRAAEGGGAAAKAGGEKP